MIVCFNVAPFEGFRSGLFTLWKELFRLCGEALDVGLFLLISSHLESPHLPTPLYAPFLSFVSLSITFSLLCCQPLSCGCCPSPSLCLLTHRPHQADPPSCLSAQEPSQWGGSAITTCGDIVIFGASICFEVFKVLFPGSREPQWVSVSTSITSLLRSHVATTDLTPP